MADTRDVARTSTASTTTAADPDRGESRATRMVDAATAPIAKSKQSRAEYRPDIDGIRGAAAIMVMGFHAKVPGFEGAYIGLDLFFVVSGYVITGLLMHEYEKNGKIRWGAFYARRARRLIPAKATMLVVVVIASYFLLSPTGSQQETAKSAAAAAGCAGLAIQAGFTLIIDRPATVAAADRAGLFLVGLGGDA